MGKQLTDEISTGIIDPVVLNPKTVNTYVDSTMLSPEELQIANNIITDNGIIEKIAGTTKVNTSAGGGVVRGLIRSYGPSTEKIALKLDNGILRSGLSAFGTQVLTGLSTSLITPFTNTRGKTYGVNTTDGIIRYDPKIARGVKTGIVGPYLRKKIAFFESDETWTTNDFGSQTTEFYRPDEWTGNAIQSLKLSVSASSSASSRCSVTLDLTAFDNTKTSDNDDYISFFTFHTIRDNINYMTVTISTGDDTYTNYKQAKLYKADFSEGDYEWTEWKVRKSAFTETGSPNWATVRSVDIAVEATVLGALTVYVDFMHLRVSLMQLKELRKQISSFNQGETWSNSSGGSLASDNQVFYEDFCSKKITADGVNYRTVTLDLSKWPDGKTSPASDEICLRVRATDKTKITGISARLGTSNSVYWQTVLSPTEVYANDQWIDCRVKKSAFSAVGGITLWSGITYSELAVDLTASNTIYFDDWRMEPYSVKKQLANCESTETWTFTNAEISTKEEGVVQGSGCLFLKGTGSKVTTSTGTVALSATTMTLATWDDGSTSTTDDLFCFNLYHTKIKNIEKLTLYLDVNNSNFANYYWYEIDKTQFAYEGTKNNVGKEIQIKKADFNTVGTGNWATISDIRFTSQAKNDGDIYIDDVQMKRRAGQTGRYYYKYVFGFDDIRSAFSEITDYIDVKGSYVSISKIKSSVDSRVKLKEIYRIGGNFPNTWMKVATIDNSIEEIVDKLQDNELDEPLGQDVPTGNINLLTCSNLCYDPQSDTVIYWNHSSYTNRVYQSNPAYHHVVNELSFRDFSSDVMFVIPWHGQYVVGLKNKVCRVVGSLLTGELIDLPVVDGCCSLYGSKRISEGILAYVGWKNVYLLDGYKSIPIGDRIKNYFRGRETYLTSVAMAYWDSCIWIACKAKTGTPTYNSVVLRYHLPSKAWTVIPNWNVNVWSIWNDKNDDDSLWYGDGLSATGDIYKINASTYQFGSSAISSEVKTGWFNIPDHELRMYCIEFKAKGTASSTLTVKGYKNLSEASTAFTGDVTLTTTWKTYTIQGVALENKMCGDSLELDFTHATDSAYFNLKDVVIYMKKVAKRQTFNEVTIS